MADQALSVSRIQIAPGRMTCCVAVAPGYPKYVTPSIMACIVRAYPTLPHHACVNEMGPRFADVMNDTSLPHVLEHLVIDIQVRMDSASGSHRLMGTTEWADEAKGQAVVSVSFANDMHAMAALNEALNFMNDVLSAIEGTKSNGSATRF